MNEDRLEEAGWIRIGDSAELVDGGLGLVFPVTRADGGGTGFAIRFRGNVYAYLNECPHIPMELEWQPGKFFDRAGLYLICSRHGAIFEPDTGLCIEGPCYGRRLQAVEVAESHGSVSWRPECRSPVIPLKAS